MRVADARATRRSPPLPYPVAARAAMELQAALDAVQLSVQGSQEGLPSFRVPACPDGTFAQLVEGLQACVVYDHEGSLRRSVGRQTAICHNRRRFFSPTLP